jgi:hypothetical protein
MLELGLSGRRSSLLGKALANDWPKATLYGIQRAEQQRLAGAGYRVRRGTQLATQRGSSMLGGHAVDTRQSLRDRSHRALSSSAEVPIEEE